MKTLIVIALALFGSTAAAAVGYDVHPEARSCVLYVDTPNGTMLRISDRRDEGVIYLGAYNPRWEPLSEIEGETMTISVSFAPKKVGYGSSVVVARNPNGMMGFSGNGFDDTLLTEMAANQSMTIGVSRFSGQTNQVETFSLRGSNEAISALRRCSKQRF